MNETDNSIELVTAYMFAPRACKRLQLKTINRFHLKTMEWENSIFYPNKYVNFYGCNLTIQNNSGQYIAVFSKLMKNIYEDQLNAKLVPTKPKTEWVFSECDLTRYDYVIMQKVYSECIVSDPVIFDSYTFAIAPGEPYTDLERMFMMFDNDLWIAVSATLAIALFATLMLSYVSRKVRNFIVGRYVQNPTMNMISIFLTGGQNTTPGRNFARFLLILFVIWSLIIRTCHQSMLFELMQADLRRPTIKTIDELFKSDLTFYTMNKIYILDEFFWEQMNKSTTRLVD